MSFQAYLDNIKTKTGKSPDDFRRLAEEKGFTQNGEIKAGIKAGDFIKWLKADFDLGHGHCMAIYALIKGVKKEGD
jgi:isocitrate lyase